MSDGTILRASVPKSVEPSESQFIVDPSKVVHLDEVRVEGEPQVEVQTVAPLIVTAPAEPLSEEDEYELGLVERALENGRSLEAQRFYENTPGVIQAQDVVGFVKGLINSPQATVEFLGALAGVDVDLSEAKVDVGFREKSGELLGEAIGPGPTAVAGGAIKGLGRAGRAFKVTPTYITNGKAGEMIGWPRGRDAAVDTARMAETLTARDVARMRKRGLTREKVEDLIEQYQRAIDAGGAKEKNRQLVPRRNLMERIRELWPKK